MQATNRTNACGSPTRTRATPGMTFVYARKIAHEADDDVGQRVAGEAEQHLGLRQRGGGPFGRCRGGGGSGCVRRIAGWEECAVELRDLADEATAEGAVPIDIGGHEANVQQQHDHPGCFERVRVGSPEVLAVGGGEEPVDGRGHVGEAQRHEDEEFDEEELPARGLEVRVHEQEALVCCCCRGKAFDI